MKIASAVVAAALAFGAPHALAQSPKSGGTLTFAVSADRKSTCLNSSHHVVSRMPSSA